LVAANNDLLEATRLFPRQEEQLWGAVADGVSALEPFGYERARRLAKYLKPMLDMTFLALQPTAALR